jgi:hypothetical protein
VVDRELASGSVDREKGRPDTEQEVGLEATERPDEAQVRGGGLDAERSDVRAVQAGVERVEPLVFGLDREPRRDPVAESPVHAPAVADVDVFQHRRAVEERLDQIGASRRADSEVDARPGEAAVVRTCFTDGETDDEERETC